MSRHSAIRNPEQLRCPLCGGTGSIAPEGVDTRAHVWTPRIPTPCSSLIRLVHQGETIEVRFESQNASDVAKLVEATLRNAKVTQDSRRLPNLAVGILNTAELEHVHSIAVDMSTVVESGCAEVVDAVTKLADAVASDHEIGQTQRAQLLDQLEELAKQATLQPRGAANPGLVRALLSNVGSCLAAAGGLAEVWSTWGPVIRKFFGV